jgi:hypothetical protein
MATLTVISICAGIAFALCALAIAGAIEGASKLGDAMRRWARQ